MLTHNRTTLRRTLLVACTLLAGLLAGCSPGCNRGGGNLPELAAVPPGEPQEIDGLWMWDSQKRPVVISRGRLYTQHEEKVLVKNIRQVAPKKYTCQAAVSAGFFPATLESVSETSLKLTTLPIPAQGYAGETHYFSKAGSEGDAGLGSVTIELDPEARRIEATTENVEVPAGAVVRTKRSRTIEREVKLSGALSAGLKGGANVKVLSAEIHAQIEKKLGQTFKQSETVEQEVQLDGNVNRKYKLTWYDKVRTGSAVFRSGGTKKRLQFQFREWSELKVEASKN